MALVFILRRFRTTRRGFGESRPLMKLSKTFSRSLGVLLASALICGAGLTVRAQDNSAKQDMKDAGSHTKDAARDTGQATKSKTKKGTKKTWNKTKSGTHKAWSKTKSGTHKAYDKTKDAGHDESNPQ